MESNQEKTPWKWARTYGIGESDHWCLETDESAAEGKTVDATLVLYLRSDTFLGQPFREGEYARLIEAAPDLYNAVLAVKKAIDAGIEDRGLGEQIMMGEAIEKCRMAFEKANGAAEAPEQTD